MKWNRNLAMIRQMALELGDLTENVVFVGGSITSLLVDSNEVNDPRVTNDVDVVVGVINAPQFSVAEQKLIERGFQPVPEVRCRYTKMGMILDFMPTDSRILGFGNRWYPALVKHGGESDLNGVSIRHATAPYFIATKLEAYLDRGKGDALASHDLEDLMYVVCGRATLVEEVANSEAELQEFLEDQIGALVGLPDISFIVEGHLAPEPVEKIAITYERLLAIAGKRNV